ncbi:MAG: carboxymuconolactone decarboxylase family protein [Bacteroidia bacterium]
MESLIVNETKFNLLKDLGLAENSYFSLLDKLAESDSRYLKDLRINTGNVFNSPNINKKESYLLALSVAYNEKNLVLSSCFEKLAEANGATVAEIAETAACTSLLNANNVFYRFRHYVEKESYNAMPAGIKMSVMGNPVLGKEFFELMSLVVSALNGCEMCVKSHEESVKNHGATESRIFDAIRLGSLLKSLSVIIK